jgi:site-specific DNA-cytosine methylase
MITVPNGLWDVLRILKPSLAIVGDSGSVTAGLLHRYEIRKPSITEIKALVSYHEEFRLVGSYHARWDHIGNSVPPNLMKTVAEHIRQHLFMNESSAP